MVDHGILQSRDEGKAGIGPQVRVDQLDRDAAQQITVLAVSPVEPATRVAPDLRNDIIDRIGAIFLGIFRAQRFCRALHFVHHRQRIGTGGPIDHGKVTGYRPTFGRVEKSPLNVALNEKRRLRRQHCDNARQHHITRADNSCHERAEQPFAHPEKPAIDHTAGQVIPPLLGPRCHRMRHMVRQDQKAFDQ